MMSCLRYNTITMARGQKCTSKTFRWDSQPVESPLAAHKVISRNVSYHSEKTQIISNLNFNFSHHYMYTTYIWTAKLLAWPNNRPMGGY